MRIYRLAQLLESKYSLQAEAASEPVQQDKIMNSAINELMNNFRLFVDPNSPHNKNPVLGILAQMGEPNTAHLLNEINKFIKTVKEMKPHHIIKAINEILALMYQMKKDKETINNFVIDNSRLSRQSDKNYRNRVIQKFWSTISIIFSVYQKVAVSLQVLAPDMVHGGEIKPERGQLSRDKYLAFMRGPASQTYGLNSFDILQKILEDQTLKAKLDTLINAIDRGHKPLDGPEVAQATRELMSMFQEKQQTNAPFFESNQPIPQAIEPEEEDK